MRMKSAMAMAMATATLGALSLVAAPANATPAPAAPAPAVAWGCHGHANKLHSARDKHREGIGFDAFQDCAGDFHLQKVCIQLQELDYYGYYYPRTKFTCSRETVAARAYKGAWVSCAGAHEGTFRTYAEGYAWPEGQQHKESGHSEGVALCKGK